MDRVFPPLHHNCDSSALRPWHKWRIVLGTLAPNMSILGHKKPYKLKVSSRYVASQVPRTSWYFQGSWPRSCLGRPRCLFKIKIARNTKLLFKTKNTCSSGWHRIFLSWSIYKKTWDFTTTSHYFLSIKQIIKTISNHLEKHASRHFKIILTIFCCLEQHQSITDIQYFTFHYPSRLVYNSTECM